MRPEDLEILKTSLQDSLIRVKTTAEIEQLTIAVSALNNLQQNWTQEGYREFLLALNKSGCLN